MAGELTTVGKLKTMLSNDMVKKRFEEINSTKHGTLVEEVKGDDKE